jgi:OPA family glycerol-3-phosphate transporter-like MFS transporter 1/2
VFAMTLFFAKLVAYTFLYWLPYYISTTAVGGRALTPSVSGPCEGRGSLQLHLDAAL